VYADDEVHISEGGDGDTEAERPSSLDSGGSLSGPPSAEDYSSGDDEGHVTGFLEGGKVESFSRAFHRLVDRDGAEGKGSVPILAVRFGGVYHDMCPLRASSDSMVMDCRGVRVSLGVN